MIHKYQLNGCNIVLDVHSGGVHIVDDLTYRMLDLIQPPLQPVCPETARDVLADTYTDAEITEAYQELYQMYQDGVLFSEDDYAQFADRMVASPIKAMCLHISHDCNLRCKYCFASTGDFGQGRMLMPVETGKKAIDFLLEHSKGRRNLELDFFGGEPLMNCGAVKEVVRYARSKEKEYNKNFRFTITTNGVLLDQEKIDFINAEMSNVVLSLDGRKEVNDRMRPDVGGHGSYDRIIDRYKALVQTRGDKDYYVRGTFTKYNLDFMEDVLHISRQGFDQLSVEPVVTDPQMPYALTEEDLPAIFAEYERLAAYMASPEHRGEFNFFHFMIDLDQGPCAIKRLRGCGCGNEYVAVTPDGDIYPCHQFVGMEEWKMGNLEDGTFDFRKKDFFAQTTIYNKEDCRTCWAKFYCSGGCNANNLQYSGDVLKAHKLSCELEKKRVECAIMIKACRMMDAE